MVLILGSSGQLGLSIKSFEPENFTFLNRESVNLIKPEQIENAIKKYAPKVIINCAAYTNVEKAEEDQDCCFETNYIAVKNLASICDNHNITLIHISTDYVFSGKKRSSYTNTDQAEPLNTYGRSKLLGENEIKRYTKKYYIFRTSWLYSEFSSNFVKKILELSKNSPSLKVVDDQIGSPTYAVDLAHFLIYLATNIKQFDSYGTYHFANQGECSWFDLANEISKLMKFSCEVIPVPSTEYPTIAKRPSFTALNSDNTIKTFNYTIPSWKESLKKCLEKIS